MKPNPSIELDWKKKACEMADLLLEARDALPAISLHSARLHNVSLSLADRIETCLEPWRVPDDNNDNDNI